MGRKKLPKNIDDIAAGFFSINEPPEDGAEEIVNETITAPAAETATEAPAKHGGGRPKKTGLRRQQFSLTMNPVMYEKLKIIADDRAGGNFAALIDAAVKSYCKTENIDIDEIAVDPEIIEYYENKQNSPKPKTKTRKRKSKK
jgi:hypothetical protein